MENIFLFIKRTPSEDGVFYEDTLGFFVNESYAKRLADHYTKRVTLLSGLNDDMYDYKETLTKKFPSPESATYHDIPKWKAGIHMDEITPEMRNERETLKEKNAQIATKENVIHKIWQKKINGLVDEWWGENLPDGLDDLETRTLLSWDDGTLYHFKYLEGIIFAVDKLDSWKYKEHWMEILEKTQVLK